MFTMIKTQGQKCLPLMQKFNQNRQSKESVQIKTHKLANVFFKI